VLVSAHPEVRADFEAMQDVVAEELNVKEVLVQADEEALVDLTAKANFKRLGPRLGKRMRLAAAAIQQLLAADIRTLRGGGTVSVQLDNGDAIDIGMEDVVVQREEKEALSVANEGDVTVALDTRLDDELIGEGWAREIVSRLQNMRKDAALEVTDRITVIYELPPEAAAAAATFADYIRNETLAVRLEPGECGDAEPAEINGVACRFVVARSSDAERD